MRYRLFPVAALAVVLFAPALHAQEKPRIERADQLPIHSYAVPAAPSSLLEDPASLAPLVEALRTDLQADLAAYDIQDEATLRSYYGALSTIAMLQGQPDAALRFEERARAFQEKPAARILSGLLLRPLVAAEKAPDAEADSAFSAALADELRRLPYDSVQAELKANRAGMELTTPALLEGVAQSSIDPAAEKGRISKDLALQLVGMSFSLANVLPHREEIVRQLTALIDAHDVEKPDIWAGRAVSLAGRSGLTPVVVAISDVGVDPGVFPGRMWTNAGEVPGNGKDDDGNGFIDDVNGIAWTFDGAPESGDLRPVTIPADALDRAKSYMKGFSDLQAGLESPEADAFRKMASSLKKDEVKPVMESFSFYTVYAHGTHVAGIASRDNPVARLLVVRIDFPYRMVPPPPSAEWASGFARAMERTVDYYRQAGVRVVNMSWGLSVGELENALELNGEGGNAKQRHRLAVAYFDTVKQAFSAAVKAAPEILFVSAAGNSDEDNEFNEFFPAAFDFPNTISVGAVDRAGDEAAFTSYGKVDVYANGYEVESVLPGGDTQRWSGTSMASPQVVNLAAKLFATHPGLSAAAVKKLIVQGAEEKEVSPGRTIRLLNPARSFELAGGGAARSGGGGGGG